MAPPRPYSSKVSTLLLRKTTLHLGPRVLCGFGSLSPRQDLTLGAFATSCGEPGNLSHKNISLACKWFLALNIRGCPAPTFFGLVINCVCSLFKILSYFEVFGLIVWGGAVEGGGMAQRHRGKIGSPGGHFTRPGGYVTYCPNLAFWSKVARGWE
jgi:hypothetical protein